MELSFLHVSKKTTQGQRVDPNKESSTLGSRLYLHEVFDEELSKAKVGYKTLISSQ